MRCVFLVGPLALVPQAATVAVFHQAGIAALGVVILGLMMAIVGIDAWFEIKRRRPLGMWVANWARRYPMFAAALAAVFGAMVGHFFWP
jgi:hypothetical protein